MPLNVITTVNLDMARPNAVVVNAVQYDSSGRVVKANLFNNGVAWQVPSGVYPVIRYQKSDRMGGFYDIDENGDYAITYENNRATVNLTLALQVLTTAGNVDVQVNFYSSSGVRVTSFAFKVRVQRSVVPDGQIVSSDYYNALTTIAANMIGYAEDAIAEMEEIEQQAASFVGSPLTAATAAAMTDTTRIYVYTGSEQGYTNGDWYYYNGTAWADGGVYNAVAVDDTLSVQGAAADAQRTGLIKDDLEVTEYDIYTKETFPNISFYLYKGQEHAYLGTGGVRTDNPQTIFSVSKYLPIDLFLNSDVTYNGAWSGSVVYHTAAFDEDRNFLGGFPAFGTEASKVQVLNIKLAYPTCKYFAFTFSDSDDPKYNGKIVSHDRFEIHDGVTRFQSIVNNYNTSKIPMDFFPIGTAHAYINSSGIFTGNPSTTWNVTEYIPIQALQNCKLLFDEAWSSSAVFAMALYTVEKGFIKSYPNANTSIKEISFADVIANNMSVSYVVLGIHPSNSSYIVFGDNPTDQKGKELHSTVNQITDLGVPYFANIEYDYNIILSYGQSFAVGSEGYIDQATSAPLGCYMLGTEAHTHKFVDDGGDLSTATLNALYVPSRTSGSSYVGIPPTVPATSVLSKRYKRLTGNNDKKFIQLSCGSGNTTVAQLMDYRRYSDTFPNLTYRSHYQNVLIPALQRCKAIADAESKTIGVVAVFFAQGESDQGNLSGTPDTTTATCSCNDSTSEWIRRVKLLKSDLESDINTIFGQTNYPAWFVGQCSGYFIYSGFGINQAQLDICNNVDIFSATPDYCFPSTSNQHLTENGYRWWGEHIGNDMADVILKCERNKNVKLLDVTVASKNTLALTFEVPVPPLQLNTFLIPKMENYGFYITKDGTAQTITDIRIIDNVVYIECNSDFYGGGNFYIRYATYFSNGDGNFQMRGAGNLCDSSSYISYHQYATDLVFSPDTVLFTATDENGNSLVGKKYPMNKFCQAFYREINT